jgi:hypothetical protein
MKQVGKQKFLKEISLLVVEGLDYLQEKIKKETNYIDNIFNKAKLHKIFNKNDIHYEEEEKIDLY